MSFNWLIVLAVVLALLLIRVGESGAYAQIWQTVTAIPLTPAQAQGRQTATMQRIG